METPDHPAVLFVEHYVARGALSLPPRALRILGRGLPEPEGRAPAPDIALLLRIMGLTGERALGEGDDPVRRREATRRGSASVAARRPDGVTASAATVAGGEGDLPARLYVPSLDTDGRLLMYVHGGGWVTGDLDTHDTLCRFLAVQMQTRVLAIDYRLAPEHPYPAAADDALAAFADIVARAAEFGARPDRIAVGGDSAGGNLAAVVAQQTAGAQRPSGALLLYPACDFTGGGPSRDTFARGFLLEKPDMDWCQDAYVPAGTDLQDARLSPKFGEVDADHPPTVVVTAGFDPLRDEGDDYAAQLREAGVPAVLRRYDGLIHGFANLTAVSPSSREAMIDCAGALRTLLELPRVAATA
ncbi:MAG: alpha/beta hydrolase [Solirubrobacteraceae bacterium]|nr:alpha/beta hydrolase [Solirubrobacteraceae bacterium]